MKQLMDCTCTRCSHTWQDYPGSHAQITRRKYPEDREGCPNCGSLYWKETPVA